MCFWGGHKVAVEAYCPFYHPASGIGVLCTCCIRAVDSIQCRPSAVQTATFYEVSHLQEVQIVTRTVPYSGKWWLLLVWQAHVRFACAVRAWHHKRKTKKPCRETVHSFWHWLALGINLSMSPRQISSSPSSLYPHSDKCHGLPNGRISVF